MTAVTIELREDRTGEVIEKFPLTQWRQAGYALIHLNRARFAAMGWEALGVTAWATDGSRAVDVSSIIKTQGGKLPIVPDRFFAFCVGYQREIEDGSRDGSIDPVDAGWAAAMAVANNQS